MKKACHLKSLSLYMVCLVLFVAHFAWAEESIKIAFNSGVTGFFAKETQSLQQGIEMAQEEIKANGGIKIGNKKYLFDIITTDNESNPTKAAKLAMESIVKGRVLAILAPTESRQAIAVAQITNGFRIPIVSAGAASPKITANKPYSFCLSASTSLQARTIVRFSEEEWQATRAAVLYEETNFYGKELAESFKSQFDGEHGKGAVVAFESFRRGDKDFTQQLQRILTAKPDFVYNPTGGNYTSLIVEQALELGLKVPFTGADFWMGSGITDTCGDKCKGFHCTLTFLGDDAKGKGAEFVAAYKKKYGKIPEEPAALAYDAVMLLKQGFEQMPALGGNLLADRKLLRNRLAQIRNFEGVAGKVSYNQSGEPELCVKVIRIEGGGAFSTYKEYCP